MKKMPKMLYADQNGNIFDHPYLLMAGMNGNKPLLPENIELIPLPDDSRLFTMPKLPPISFDPSQKRFVTISEIKNGRKTEKIEAVAAFMAPGYMRTLLPACDYSKKKNHLPLWSYTAVGWDEENERFVVAASKVDNNQNWNPCNYDDRTLDPLVRKMLKKLPENRLIEQLSRCAIDYHCFAAKNLFYQRWEAPLPISPVCNSQCLGCISLQPSDCCPSNHDRISFVPTPKEIAEIAIPHLINAKEGIVSFGQGCEGDPIMQYKTAAEAVKEIRKVTDNGTINFNSNGSFPDRVQYLCDAGVQSFRFSMNSVQEDLYNRYYRPKGYSFGDVKKSVLTAKNNGKFTMINYLVSPGVSDSPKEVEAILKFVGNTGIDMIQMRNLSIDPDYYNKEMKVGEMGIGMYNLLKTLKKEFPKLQFGYYNRTKEKFYPEGYETDWERMQKL